MGKSSGVLRENGEHVKAKNKLMMRESRYLFAQSKKKSPPYLQSKGGKRAGDHMQGKKEGRVSGCDQQ